MYDGSTPNPEPAFAVGYGNGYGYEPMAPVTPSHGTVAAHGSASPRWGEAAVTSAVHVDPDATVAMATPVAVAAAAAPAPYAARPVGAAHPRRRFGRGLVLAGVTLLVAGAGISAAAIGSTAEIHAASASATRSGGPAAVAAADTVGDQLGRGVDPHGGPGAIDPSIRVPVSLIEPIAIEAPPAVPPATVPPATAPPTTAPPTTTPPTSNPPTTAPPATTPPTTTPQPTAPVFTTLSVPSTVHCPAPDTQDATATFTWSAPGATHVTLSIDGPGLYRSYSGPSGTETVNFPCSTAHTYLFIAHGSDGSVTSTSFTVTPA